MALKYPKRFGGGGGALKAPTPPIFCPHAFNFGAALLSVGDFPKNGLAPSDEKKIGGDMIWP